MKLQSIVLAVGALFSSVALACPDLRGSYTCSYDEGPQVVTIAQEDRGGVTYYKVDGDELPADNVSRALPEDPNFQNGTFRGWCEGNDFKVEVTGKVFDQGRFFGDLRAVVGFAANAANLTQTTTGSLTTGEKTYPLDNVVTCKRN